MQPGKRFASSGRTKNEQRKVRINGLTTEDTGLLQGALYLQVVPDHAPLLEDDFAGDF